jgi:glycogen debranching enzyme
MIPGRIPHEIDDLVNEYGFGSVRDLISFSLALGIFYDSEGDPTIYRDMISPETLPSYTLSAIVLSDGGNVDIDIEEMRERMLRRISGGVEILYGKIGNKNGLKALEEVARLIPVI